MPAELDGGAFPSLFTLVVAAAGCVVPPTLAMNEWIRAVQKESQLQT